MRIPYSILLVPAMALAMSRQTPGQASDSSMAVNQGRTFRVSGLVTDPAHEPLPGVEIIAVDSGPLAGRNTRTDDQGRFDLGNFRPGMLSLRVRRLGYEERTFGVDVGANGKPTSIEIMLSEVPQELANVDVTASLPPGKLRGFYQRRQQSGSFARFLIEQEILRIGPRNASDLLRGVPGVTLASTQSGGNAIRIRGCQPMVWVDDQRVPGAELDELMVPSDIAAIEFYPSSAGIPAQYLERGNRLCGLILVWTKTT